MESFDESEVASYEETRRLTHAELDRIFNERANLMARLKDA
ncbi:MULTISPECIES: hypothetical protein [Corynebacterium]|nr:MULTISPECIES: hypothetical protein [Corynebacterium]MDK8241924.1 hypothetical protein [Corynebacterium coyleae]MDK8664675.1 hypothetical protein [Corynebacterium coyleae]MDK8707759.1 hypothetical protein [Corynebacterium coyleae]MDK8734608.1 hypothetical protein [Corynebacterium coyleae]MDK8800040.1 hypothetical protein [Corynebacterium coyleae]